MRFLHAADIHLDSPLKGLERYEGAPLEELRTASRRAFENLVDLALEEETRLVLIAGDLYDVDWKDYNTGLFFVKQVGRLTREGIRVVLIRGNHDASSKITKELRLPEGVSDLSTRKPQTLLFEDLGIAVHGQGYPKTAVTEDLSAGYPEATKGHFNIGLLHTAVDGRTGHAPYAPCRMDWLISKGYDYWALGHVHRREVLCENPWIVFPGNIQGRHARESGPKGATLVTVEGGEVAAAEHRDLDAVRWAVCDVDVSGASSGGDAVDLAAEALEAEAGRAGGRLLAARLRLVGVSKAHAELNSDPEKWTAQIRGVAVNISEDIFVEKILFQTRTDMDLDALMRADDTVGGLLRSIRGTRTDPKVHAELVSQFEDLWGQLPLEYKDLVDALDLSAGSTFEGLIEEAEQFLLPRLLDGGGKP